MNYRHAQNKGMCSAGCGCVSRRAIFATGGALAMTSLAPAMAQKAPAKPDMIDVHHHVVPPFWFDEVKDHISAQGGGRIVPNWYGWSPEKALSEMDKSGVKTAILSVSAPGVWFGDAAASKSLSRRCNEYMADLVRKHPDRFGFFAALPYPDHDGAIAELDYALDHLGADGVGLFTSYGDKWLGDPSFHPIIEQFNKRKAVVYVHPAAPECCTKLIPYVPPFLTEFIQDTNRAILSMMYSGALHDYPDARWIFSHAGGSIPTLEGRIIELAPSVPALQAKTPNGVHYELQRLYYEVADSASRPAIAALTAVARPDHIMFGSDFPLVPLPVTANGLPKVGLSPAELRKVRYENARALFPHLGKAKA